MTSKGEVVEMPFPETLSVTCGFFFCTPPGQNWQGGPFALLFFSLWNSMCAALVMGGFQNFFQTKTPASLCKGCLICLIPHVPVGWIVPFLTGGLLFVLIAIWPYYLAIWRVSRGESPSPFVDAVVRYFTPAKASPEETSSASEDGEEE